MKDFLTGLLLGLVLAWICTGRAELIRVRVLLSQPQQVEEWYPSVVMSQVRERFREDLGVRMRVKFRKSSKVPHSYDLDLADDDFTSYLHKVKRSKVWIKLALVPAYWRDGVDYSAGFGIWDFAMATIRQARLTDGADRYDYDWITAGHELAHTLNAEHIDFVPNVMAENALAYASPELRFLVQTKKEVKNFLKERKHERTSNTTTKRLVNIKRKSSARKSLGGSF